MTRALDESRLTTCSCAASRLVPLPEASCNVGTRASSSEEQSTRRALRCDPEHVHSATGHHAAFDVDDVRAADDVVAAAANVRPRSQAGAGSGRITSSHTVGGGPAAAGAIQRAEERRVERPRRRTHTHVVLPGLARTTRRHRLAGCRARSLAPPPTTTTERTTGAPRPHLSGCPRNALAWQTLTSTVGAKIWTV
ncbi:hypothetical protein MTO96_027476 [Rhipicephalus appendiculatus]